MIHTLKPTQLPPKPEHTWNVIEDTKTGKKLFVLQLLGGSGNSFNPHYEIAATTISDFDLTMQVSVLGKKPQEVLDSMAGRLIQGAYY